MEPATTPDTQQATTATETPQELDQTKIAEIAQHLVGDGGQTAVKSLPPSDAQHILLNMAKAYHDLSSKQQPQQQQTQAQQQTPPATPPMTPRQQVISANQATLPVSGDAPLMPNGAVPQGEVDRQANNVLAKQLQSSLNRLMQQAQLIMPNIDQPNAKIIQENLAESQKDLASDFSRNPTALANNLQFMEGMNAILSHAVTALSHNANARAQMVEIEGAVATRAIQNILHGGKTHGPMRTQHAPQPAPYLKHNAQSQEQPKPKMTDTSSGNVADRILGRWKQTGIQETIRGERTVANDVSFADFPQGEY